MIDLKITGINGGWICQSLRPWEKKNRDKTWTFATLEILSQVFHTSAYFLMENEPEDDQNTSNPSLESSLESSRAQKSQATRERNRILQEIEARKLVADVAAGGEC